uniref:Ig-like domain-containing protein n=1 Tax=Electrophorus electricus TaxID=8005 RepID=A0A4W4FDA7_ELEEL
MCKYSVDRVKFVRFGENIHLTCSFSSSLASTTAWFKHTPGEKPLLIASAYHSEPVLYYKHFNKTGHHNAIRNGTNFTLSISNAKPSDSATYYCATVSLNKHKITFSIDTPAIHYDVLQHPVLNPVMTGSNAPLKCTVLTKRCAGEHSVYCFRHGSGESHPGIIYTHGDRSGQCKNCSEAGFYTQRCMYMLPKKNLSLSDAGTYYCAVAECGEIIFGNGTKLNFAGTLNYAALSFAHSHSPQRTKAKFNSDQSVYAQVKAHQ